MATAKKQNYLTGAAILTLAVIIVKILGAIYKIPIANILGDEGYAHFNVAYNLYNVLLTISTAGLPIALARLVSEANNLDRPNQVKKTFKVAVIAFAVLGSVGTLCMFLFPTELAAYMEDVEAAQSVQIMAPAVLLCCIMSAYRGYTQGLSDMRPTSVSQVVEVAAKVVFGLLIVIYLNSLAEGTPIMSAGAISGVAVGSLIACIYIAVVAHRRMKLEHTLAVESGTFLTDKPDKGGTILKQLVKIGIPIALSSCVLTVITLINTKLILGRLQEAAGYGFYDAKVLFGVYSKALTLYNLPAAIITPITISVVPAIAGFLAKKENDNAKNVVESSLRISALIAMPMAVGLSVLSTGIMDGIYPGSAEQGTTLLAIMGIASFFVCLSLVSTAILQAAGRERLPVYTMLIGGALNIVVNYFLVGNPNINIYGAPIGTMVCYMIMSGVNLYFVKTKLPIRPMFSKSFIKPAVNSVVMGVVAYLVYTAVMAVMGAGTDAGRGTVIIGLIAAVVVGVGVYLVLTVITRAITKDDVELLPKGEKIAKLLKIR